MTEELTLLSFKAICSFVNDLNSFFGNKQKSLKLYARLINKTPFTNEEAIKRHILCFSNFCVANRKAIREKNVTELTHKHIVFTKDKIYINMELIFSLASSEPELTKDIWSHLLTISALIDPSGGAKQILMTDEKKEKNEAKIDSTDDPLIGMFNKVQGSINPNASVPEIFSSVMQSGILTDLMSGMQSGQLNIGQMLGSIQKMMNSAGGDSDPQMQSMMNMMGSMASNLSSMSTPGGPGGGSSQAPDLSGMMSMMGTVLAGMGGGAALEPSRPPTTLEPPKDTKTE